MFLSVTDHVTSRHRTRGKQLVGHHNYLLLGQYTSSLWLNDELVNTYFYMKTHWDINF